MLTIQTRGRQLRLPCRSVAFAGSRHGSLNPELADRLVGSFCSLGDSFLVGCAPGIDACFRDALARHASARAVVACAFRAREKRMGSTRLCALTVVPEKLSSAAALHRRTVWLVRRSSILVLFPLDPSTGRWGKGSRLAFNTALYNLKPVFVVTNKRPDPVPSFLIFAASLFDVLPGYWIVPCPEKQGGVCGDEW